MIRTVALVLLLLVGLDASAALTDRLLPSQATRAGSSSLSPNAQIIDLTLSDAIYLGLRDNRAIRSAYLIASRRNLTCWWPKTALPQAGVERQLSGGAQSG